MAIATNKENGFEQLIEAVRTCLLCPRMATSARVLNYSAGNPRAEVMFVGEAPGRLGADETEVPFHGDTSGRNFEDLIAFAGMTRNEIFVTNAVLCNPKDEHGNNSTPSTSEVLNCAGFLRRQIEFVNPRIVVSLGAVALRALAIVSSHELQLAAHVRTIKPWFSRHVIPLYHPGQRAMIHRSFANQRSDYQFVSEQWRRLSERPQKRSGATKAGILRIAQNLLRNRPEISYFELHKLAYLVEYVHVRRFGRRVTSGYFIRQKDGPYCTDLQIERLKRADPFIRIFNREGQLFLTRKNAEQTNLFGESEEELSADVKTAVDDVLQRYAYVSASELKTAVYLTAPMRCILRREQRERTNLYNAPIDFLAAT